jgi:hypothetical protein
MMYSKYTGLGEASLFEKIGVVGCICDRGGYFLLWSMQIAKEWENGYEVAVENDRFVKG